MEMNLIAVKCYQPLRRERLALSLNTCYIHVTNKADAQHLCMKVCHVLVGCVIYDTVPYTS